MLVTHLTQLIPFGTIAFRSQLFSALCFSFASVFLFLFLKNSLESIFQPSFLRTIFPALTATFAFAVNPVAWENACQTEVHGLVVLLFSMTLFIIPYLSTAPKESLPIFFFLAGLQIIHHRISAFLLAGVLLFYIVPLWRNAQLSSKEWLYSIIAFMLPLLLLLYFPLRAMQNPAINWYDPETLSRFYSLFTGKLYTRILHDGFALLPRMPAGYIADNFFMPFLSYSIISIMIIPGCICLFQRKTLTGFFIVGLYAVYQFFVLVYMTGDWQTYMLPAILLLSLPLAAGLGYLLEYVEKNCSHLFIMNLCTLPIAGLIFLTANVSMSHLNKPLSFKDLVNCLFPKQKNALGHFKSVLDTSSTDYGSRVWASVPDHAVILTGLDANTADNEYFPLLYQHIVEKRGDDTVLIGGGFLYLDWYREQVNRLLPLNLAMRNDQLALSPELWLEDTWKTVAEPCLKIRPMISTSFPQPSEWNGKVIREMIDSFPMDHKNITESYRPYIPKGYVFKLSQKNSGQ